MNKKQKKQLFRIIIATILFIILKILGEENESILRSIVFVAAYIIIGYDIILKALKGFKKGSFLDENFLMAFATIGAIALGELDEGVAVMLFYQIGEFFQSYAVRKSRKNITELMDIRPDYANLLIDGEITKVNPSEVSIGSLVQVNVGEKVPLDGYVYKGTTSLNTSALTGESKPKYVKVNDEIISGCINLTSPIIIKTIKEFGESTVSKVLNLVENATTNKSKSEDFISKFARYYTPAVVCSAIIVATIPPLYNLLIGNNANFQEWIFKALTLLVISCPCALVISIPLSFFAGIGGASNSGILIKGSNYLETISKVKYVVFDKTGTMTKGVFEINGIHHNVLTNEKILEYAAHAEIYSNHPIALSIKKEYGKKLHKEKVTSIQEISGEGIIAIISNKKVIVGNEKIMLDNDIKPIMCSCIGTVVHVAVDGEYMGHILINDIIKPTSKKAILELKKIGIKKTVMLTGDSKKVAENIAAELEIDEVYSELLPDQKVQYLESILASKDNKDIVAFVGDGINDAPSIARSDIGISMGALGSDAAIEAADIVLMDDDPLKISKAIKIGKKCLRIVYENIYFAIGIKVLCIILNIIGITNMWMAIFADVGVMVIAVINAIRVLSVKKL